MDDGKQVLAWLKNALWSSQRKWSEFVGGFTVLKPGLDGGWKQPLQQRLSLNLRFYKANYAFIAAILSVWFMTWSLMFAALFMGAAYGFLFYVRRAPFIVGGVLVTQRQQLLAWRIGAALVFLLTAPYWSMVKMCFFVGLVILAHGTFRTPTRMQMDAGSSKLHGLFDGGAGSDTEDVDEEAGANDADAEAEEAGYAGGALGGATGPLPGTVETRHRKNEEYMARRARLQSQYPNLAYQQ